jgi:2-keto-3-deoxy-6-phosphogluconate aldolase
VAFVPDLMDRSKVSAAAPHVVFVASAAALVAAVAGDGADLVVVDLSRSGVLDALRALPAGVPSIGFGSHVDTELLAAAAAAGCGTVLPRSRFFTRLAALLA